MPNTAELWTFKDGKLVRSSAMIQKGSDGSKPALHRRSYVRGRRDDHVTYATLPELLEKRAEECPDMEAHVFWKPSEDNGLIRESVSFGELAERSTILASCFLDMGLNPGDRIAIIGDNCLDWLYVEYATLRIGICLIRLQRALVTELSVRRVIVEQRCRALVINPGRDGAICRRVVAAIGGSEEVDKMAVDMRLLTIGHEADGRHIRSIRTLMETPTDRAEDVTRVQTAIDPYNMAVAFSTSGSGGFPRFVGMTHFACVNNILAVSRGHFDAGGVTFFCDRPFTWIGAGVHVSVVLGITTVHADQTLTQHAKGVGFVLQVMEMERVTAFVANWAIIDEVCRSKDESVRFPPQLTHVLVGGERPSARRLEFCQETFEYTMLFYGSSECGLAARAIIPKNNLQCLPVYRLEPISNVEMKVTDDDGEILAVGRPGKLWIRSPYLFKSYLKFEADGTFVESASGPSSGSWYDTGDCAVVHESGTVEVVGRQSDSILHKDQRVYFYNYESALQNLQGIRESFVFSVTDPEGNQKICACVVFEEGCVCDGKEVKEHCVRSGLNPVPTYFLSLEEFPRLPNGKIDRQTLRVVAMIKCSKS